MIREAVPADAEAIDRVHVRAWDRAYGDFVAPDLMPGAESIEDRVGGWRERLRDPLVRTWVFELDRFVAGFASTGAGELTALYVDPGAQGAGVGSALLEHVEGALRDAGAARAQLWVFSADEPARRFYESRGWQLAGEGGEQGHRAAPAVCYRRSL